jgi:hypothetical protein
VFGVYVSPPGLTATGVPGIYQYPRDQAFGYDGFEQDEFLAELFARGSVSLEAGRRAFIHSRKLYVLIDGAIGSAAEVGAEGLKKKAAVLVGERSAAAMLVSVRENVAPDWI